jgi:hypothetical protein
MSEKLIKITRVFPYIFIVIIFILIIFKGERTNPFWKSEPAKMYLKNTMIEFCKKIHDVSQCSEPQFGGKQYIYIYTEFSQINSPAREFVQNLLLNEGWKFDQVNLDHEEIYCKPPFFAKIILSKEYGYVRYIWFGGGWDYCNN